METDTDNDLSSMSNNSQFSKRMRIKLRRKVPYSEFFWSVLSPNTGKYGPEKLRILTPFTQCYSDYQDSKITILDALADINNNLQCKQNVITPPLHETIQHLKAENILLGK